MSIAAVDDDEEVAKISSYLSGDEHSPTWRCCFLRSGCRLWDVPPERPPSLHHPWNGPHCRQQSGNWTTMHYKVIQCVNFDIILHYDDVPEHIYFEIPTSTYVHMCIRTHTYICTHVHTYTCIHMYSCAYVHIHLYICAYLHIHTYICTRMCAKHCAYIHICIHICLNIHSI